MLASRDEAARTTMSPAITTTCGRPHLASGFRVLTDLLMRPVVWLLLAASLCDQAFAADAAKQGEVAPGVALEQSLAPASCDMPAHHQLDFWLGDWQVFDGNTNQLVAISHVEKHSEGCIIEERLNFLTDMYRRPAVKVRLSGVSISRFDGEAWLQMWADNQWGAIFLRGALDAQGKMVFLTAIPSRKRDVKLVYVRQADGSVQILQYVAPAGSGKWVQYGDLIYRPNH
jgi:hypothetical protein